MKGGTVEQRFKRGRRQPECMPTTIRHSVVEWAFGPRKRDRRVRPGGKLPAGTSVAVRAAARLARERAR